MDSASKSRELVLGKELGWMKSMKEKVYKEESTEVNKEGHGEAVPRNVR